jgi:hypothetical protein
MKGIALNSYSHLDSCQCPHQRLVLPVCAQYSGVHARNVGICAHDTTACNDIIAIVPEDLRDAVAACARGTA